MIKIIFVCHGNICRSVAAEYIAKKIIKERNIEHLLKLEDNYINIMDFNALGLFDGVIVPHCEANEYTPELREKIYSELLKEKKYNVYKLTNDESLIVTEEKIIKKI